MARIRLLIVDDMPQVRRELCRLLPLAGPVVVVGEAGDGDSAVAQAATLHPDVVLMDLEMPRMGGLAACRAIKATGLARTVVVLSIYADAESAGAARAAGADAFVAKGASLDELMAAIMRPAENEEGACPRQ